MPLYRSAYDTRACKGFMTAKLTHALLECEVMGVLPTFANSHLRMVQPNNHIAIDKIPSFVHPMVEASPEKGEKAENVYVDVRRFGRWDPHTESFVLKVRNSYDLQVLRGRLNVVWVNENPNVLASFSPLPMKLYGIWVSQAVARRFALDQHEQFQLQILASVFYASLFHAHHDDWDSNRVAAMVQRAVGAQGKMVQDVLAHCKSPIDSLDAFCQMAYDVTQAVQLREFNYGILYTVLKSTWYGADAVEIVAVALEHIPTWLALLYTAATDRGYMKSNLGLLIQTWDRKDKGMGMVMSLNKALEQG